MAIERRGELAEAAIRVVARSGLGAVTFRSVAAESGWSLGAVQKTFASKQQLLGAVVEFAEQRVALTSAAPGEPDLVTWLVELGMRSLPVDESRRTLMLITSAYATEAATDEDQARALAQRDAGIRAQFARLIARERAAGRVDGDLDDDATARAYLAVTAGLAGQLLYDPLPEGEAQTLLRGAVEALVR